MSYISFLEFPTGLPKSGRWVPYTFKRFCQPIKHSTSWNHDHKFFFEKFNFKSFKPFLGEYSTIVFHGNSRVPAHTPNTTTSTHLPGMDDATCHLEAVSLIVIHGDDMGPAPINGRKSMGKWCSGAPINGVHVLIFPRTIEADEHFNGAFWRGLFQHRSNEVTKGLRGAILRDQGERMCFS